MEENSIPAASGLGTNPTAPVKVTLSKRTLIRAGVVLVVILVIVGIVFWFMNRSALPPGVLATVNDEPVYTTYLDKELAFYPGTKSAEVKKMLTQKIIDDQLTLEAAQKEKLIKNYPNAADMSTQDYLKRTDLVAAVKQKINNSGNVIKGRMVMVWFYNNRQVGPKGFEEGKKIAYATIKPLYDQVKSKKMTIEQAGQTIRADKSLAEIDAAYESNAIDDFTFYKGGSGTFWPEFNDLLWKTEQGELTPLYLGGGAMRDGKPSEELYIFAQIDEKSFNPNYTDYKSWLENKKKGNKIILSAISSVIQLFNPEYVYADNDDDNTGRSGVWSGHVLTRTGAGIQGADVYIRNGCTGNPGMHLVTDGNAYFNSGTSYDLSCLCNPQTLYAKVSGMDCDPFNDQYMGNGVADIYHDIYCGSPPPTPTPRAPVCNQPCTAFECQGAWDGCSVCTPNATGGRTCQPPQTPTPVPPTPTPGPQCNSACVRAADCTGDAARNGCTACLPTAGGGTTCQIPPTPTPTPILTCNTACTSSAACQRGVDGCTTCIPNDTGTGSSCKPPPACGTSCKKDSQCAGAKNGCSICGDAGKCTAFSADMCKCDGMDFAPAKGGTTFFPGDDVTFIAFGKVEGSDINVADLQSMTFSLYQSSLTNPNQSTRLAQSTAITPTIVQNDANKVRYKVTWSRKIPSTVPSGSLFRVQAKIKCVAKPGVLGAKTAASSNYYADVFQTIRGLLSNTKIVLGETTQDQQQATSFFPGAKISEKSCSIIKFYFE